MKKMVKWIVLAIVLLVVIGVAVVLMNLDGIIRRTVETQAASQLQVPTTLGGVHLSILGGSVALSDLSVGSPKGFTAPQMFALGKASVQVSYSDLRGDPVRVGTIAVDKPKLVIEQSGMNLNFKALMDQMPKGDTTAPPPGQPAPEGKPLKLIIDQINLTGAEVVFKGGVPGLDKELSIPIPDLSLKQIGNSDGNGNGAALKDVVMQVVTAMAAAASDSDKIPPALKVLLKGNVGDVAGQLGGVFKDQIGAKLGDSAGAAVGDVLKGKAPTTQDLGNAANDLFTGFGKKKNK